jgi:hypothetical protein
MLHLNKLECFPLEIIFNQIKYIPVYRAAWHDNDFITLFIIVVAPLSCVSIDNFLQNNTSHNNNIKAHVDWHNFLAKMSVTATEL